MKPFNVVILLVSSLLFGLHILRASDLLVLADYYFDNLLAISVLS